MLSPDSRTVAFELLRPPPGHILDFAVLTTYTLNLEASLALPLGMVSRSDGGLEELLADPILLLEALRGAGERIHVFVDQTGIAIPRKKRELYAMLESSLHPVRAEGGGVFHPKVWILRFLSEEQEPLIRVAILSRNLTFDRSWDIAFRSEACPSPTDRIDETAPLADFVHHLPDMAPDTLSSEAAGQIRTLADQVSRTRFPAPEGFLNRPVAFHVLGMNGRHTMWRPIREGWRTLAVAPFVGRTALDAIANMGTGERMLVSTREELDKLPEEVLSAWEPVCVLSDTALDEREDECSERPSGLHAKMIAIEHRWNVTWFVGSANLTESAFTGRNVEVMAAITARKGRPNGKTGQGIERFLESGFDKLCEPYRPSETEPDPPEVAEAKMSLEKARDILLDAGLRIVCSPSDDSWVWTIDGHLEPRIDSVEIEAWPLTVAADQASLLQLPLTWTLPVQRLTALVAFCLHVPVDGTEDLRFVLRLPVDGMPEDRMHHLLRSLIDSPERFLAFLRALLGGLDELVDWARDDSGQGGGADWGIGPDNAAMLEDLVRTAARDPSRLEPVRRLIDDMRKTDEGREIVPDDFLCLWNAVQEAVDEDGGA